MIRLIRLIRLIRQTWTIQVYVAQATRRKQQIF
jgi:hypothetical protein